MKKTGFYIIKDEFFEICQTRILKEIRRKQTTLILL